MSEQQPRQPEEYARRLGTFAGRLKRAARRAQPGVERQARTARDAARPAADRALRFVREHDREIKSYGTMGARAMASRVGPPALRPVMLVVADELVRDNGRDTGEKPADATNEQPTADQPREAPGEETPRPPHIF